MPSERISIIRRRAKRGRISARSGHCAAAGMRKHVVGQYEYFDK